jgi:hypothetical protein
VLEQSRHLRQANAVWLRQARAVRHASSQLRHHAHALCTRAAHWRQHYLLVVCAWCTQRIRWEVLEEAGAEPVTSHGICATCFAHLCK